MGALAGRKALVKVTGAPVSFTDEATTGNVGHTVYTITNPAKRCWDATATITVKVDGVTANPTTYTLNRVAGTVTFASSQGASVVTVSGSYLPLTAIAGGKAFTLTLQASQDDASTFGDTYKTSTRGMLDASGSIGAWLQSGTNALRADLVADTPVVLEIYANASSAYTARVRATLNKEQIQAAVQGNIDQSVDFQGAVDVDGNAVAVN